MCVRLEGIVLDAMAPGHNVMHAADWFCPYCLDCKIPVFSEESTPKTCHKCGGTNIGFKAISLCGETLYVKKPLKPAADKVNCERCAAVCRRWKRLGQGGV